jgi:hypothetical protein
MRNFLPKEELKSEPSRFIVRIGGKLPGLDEMSKLKKPGRMPVGKAPQSARPYISHPNHPLKIETAPDQGASLRT